MNQQEKKPMLSFDPAALPTIAIVHLASFYNHPSSTRMKTLAELPHVLIPVVATANALRSDVFVRFDNNEWDNALHDQMKLASMLDSWLEKLNVELNRGATEGYDFATTYQGYRPEGTLYRRDGSPLAFQSGDQSRHSDPYISGPGRWGHAPMAYPFEAGPGMYFAGQAAQNPSYDPKAATRRMVAMNLLTQLTEYTGKHLTPRLSTAWQTNRQGEDELYIEGTVGGGVNVVIRREEFAQDSDSCAVPREHIGGTVAIAGQGPAYHFAFYHSVLGNHFRDSVSNSTLNEAFQDAWVKFNRACAFEGHRPKLVFND